jgi:hypothetical protein
MTHWTVIDREAAVLTCSYPFARDGTANTLVARMGDGGLMVVSPCRGLDDAAARELESFGPVRALVANNGFHHMGLGEWRRRFPLARCFAAPAAARRIEKKNPAAGHLEPLDALPALAGPDIGVHGVADSPAGESWCWVRASGGYVWYVSDVLINLPALPAALLPRLLFRATGSAPGFRVFHLALARMVKDKKAALRQLRDDMERQPPAVIVPAHGRVLSGSDLAERARALIDAAL